MTVINTMQFDSQKGGMVTDTQGSTEVRKYDISEKVSTYEGEKGNAVLLGGSGSSSVLYEARGRLSNAFPKQRDFSTRGFAYELGDILTEIGRDLIDREMRGRFGFGAQEFIAGRTKDGSPIGNHVLSEARELYQGCDPHMRQRKDNVFLVLGRDAEGIALYAIPMGERPVLSSIPYASIGSGRDESDKVLYDFLRGIPRSGRHNIDFVTGMSALIRATNRSTDINHGVGGIPTIAHFDGKNVTQLGENESLLATEVVKVRDYGLISQSDMHDALGELLTGTAQYRDVEERVFNARPNYKEIMRALRGYRTGEFVSGSDRAGK